MNIYQISALGILTVCYAAYITKLLGQRKKGIQTMQLGMGNKSGRTIIVEKALSKVTVVIGLIEVVSIIFEVSFPIHKLIKLAGILVAACGTGIFILAMITMQDSWRAGIPSGGKTQLVTSGIYKISRNPAFLGFDFLYIGIGTAFFNPVLAFISILGIVLIHFQILEEEFFLSKAFGEEYETYKQTVGRYFKVK